MTWLIRAHPFVRSMYICALFAMIASVPRLISAETFPSEVLTQLAFIVALVMMGEPLLSGAQIAVSRAPHGLVDRLMFGFAIGGFWSTAMLIVTFDPHAGTDPASSTVLYVGVGAMFGLVMAAVVPGKQSYDLLLAHYDPENDVTRTRWGRRCYYGLPFLTLLGIGVVLVTGGSKVAADPTGLWFFMIGMLTLSPRYQMRGSYLLNPRFVGGLIWVLAFYYG